MFHTVQQKYTIIVLYFCLYYTQLHLSLKLLEDAYMHIYNNILNNNFSISELVNHFKKKYFYF